jgi:hypothetical protein
LRTGDPEVEENQVRRREARRRRYLDQLAEATLDDRGGRPKSGKRTPAGFNGCGIAVDPEQPSARCDPLENLAGVAGHPKGAVDRDRPLPGLEQLYYFF